MFFLFEYLETIYQEITVLKAIYKVSSIMQLEEMLSDIRNNPDCCLLVRDSGDGFLNFKSKRLDVGYQMFYVMVRADGLSSNNRMEAKRKAMMTGIKLIDRMRSDAEDFGDPVYGLNDSRIDYAEIGPIGRNYVGYSFSFLVEQGFVKQT